jgi:hypothetical protein
MVELATAKYVRELPLRKTHHPEILGPIPQLDVDEKFGDMGFTTYWEGITKAFVHADKPHAHDFPQYLFFLGMDPMHVNELDAEIEINLSLDGKKLDKYMLKKATCIYIPAGLYHNPLIYHKVNKPFMFIDLYFSKEYKRK